MIFVDSGAWIALFSRRDQFHTDARVVYESIKQQRAKLLTTDYIVDETVTRIRYDAGFSAADTFLLAIEHAEATGELVLETISRSAFQRAKQLFRQYSSERLSFTDCTSFVVCKKYGISVAFAFDHHFPIMGITLLQ